MSLGPLRLFHWVMQKAALEQARDIMLALTSYGETYPRPRLGPVPLLQPLLSRLRRMSQLLR
ncbi:hypothetical protein ABIB85_004393 [Bradyrhizobium sp. JR1.5]